MRQDDQFVIRHLAQPRLYTRYYIASRVPSLTLARARKLALRPMTHCAESADLRTDVVSSFGGGWRFLLIARHVCSSTQPSEGPNLTCVLERTNCRGYPPDIRKLGEPML